MRKSYIKEKILNELINWFHNMRMKKTVGRTRPIPLNKYKKYEKNDD